MATGINADQIAKTLYAGLTGKGYDIDDVEAILAALRTEFDTQKGKKVL